MSADGTCPLAKGERALTGLDERVKETGECGDNDGWPLSRSAERLYARL